MAPELFAEDGVYSTASDLWSLGCVLYELAVGNPPFVSNNFEELVEMIIWADVPLSHRRTLEKSNNQVTLSPQFQDLLHGLLQKEPQNRLKWAEVLKHPFWDSRLMPKPQKIPDEALYKSMLAARSAVNSRSHSRSPSMMDREASEKSSPSTTQKYAEDDFDVIEEESNLGNESNYTNSEWDGNETSKTTFAGEFQMSDVMSMSKDHNDNDSNTNVSHRKSRASKQGSSVDIMRLSRIVRENMENEKSVHAYNDRNDNRASDGILANADTEVDFSDNSKTRQGKDASYQEESLGDEIEDDVSNGGDDELGLSNQLEDDEDSNEDENRSRERLGAASPQTFVAKNTTKPFPNVTNEKNGGLSQPPAHSSNNQNTSRINRYERNERHLLQLILDGIPISVSPISGNRSIETPTQLNFKTSALPFKPESAKIVAKMSQKDLEKFLTKIYRGLSGDSIRRPTVSEKVNILCYFASVCSPARIANLIVNSSMMRLLVKLARKHSTVPNLRAAISRLMSTLFRHATYIAADMADDGVLRVLVEMVRDRHPSVRRAAMAALGELLFYITTEDQENDAENSPTQPEDDGNNRWIVPGNVASLLDRVLRVNHGNSGSSAMTDEVVQHYATKPFKICLLKVFLHKWRDSQPKILHCILEMLCAVVVMMHTELRP